MMSQGKHYTTNEDKRLLKLYDDNKNVPLTKLGEMALEYGCVESRSNVAIAQHIRNLITARDAENNIDSVDDSEEMQYEIQAFRDIEYSVVKAERDEYKRKWEDFINAILESSTLHSTPYYDSLFLDFGVISRKLSEYVPEMVDERIKALKEYESLEKKHSQKKRKRA